MFDYGSLPSVRESVSEPKHHYFLSRDEATFVTLAEFTLLRALEMFIEEHKIDPTQFANQKKTLIEEVEEYLINEIKTSDHADDADLELAHQRRQPGRVDVKEGQPAGIEPSRSWPPADAGSGGLGSSPEGPLGPNQPPDRYLVVEAPARIRVSANVSVIVYVAVKSLPRDPPHSVLMKPFDVPPEGAKITVIVQAPESLRPLEPLEQVLQVPQAEDSEPVRFAFHTEKVGLFQLSVMAFAGGTFLGELVAEISVEPAAGRTSPRRWTADLQSPEARLGEVTLQVRFDGDRYSFQLLSDSYLFEPVLAEALTAHPGAAVERALATLRAMAGQRSCAARIID